MQTGVEVDFLSTVGAGHKKSPKKSTATFCRFRLRSQCVRAIIEAKI